MKKDYTRTDKVEPANAGVFEGRESPTELAESSARTTFMGADERLGLNGPIETDSDEDIWLEAHPQEQWELHKIRNQRSRQDRLNNRRAKTSMGSLCWQKQSSGAPLRQARRQQ